MTCFAARMTLATSAQSVPDGSDWGSASVSDSEEADASESSSLVATAGKFLFLVKSIFLNNLSENFFRQIVSRTSGVIFPLFSDSH